MSADPLSRVFSVLADPTRRDIVARLTLADATVNELAEPYDVSLQAVSKHVKVLERLRFEDLGDGRTRLVTESLCDSFEGRDAMLSSGMADGVRECYEKLDEVLAS